jgi:hypothetical protein
MHPKSIFVKIKFVPSSQNLREQEIAWRGDPEEEEHK